MITVEYLPSDPVSPFPDSTQFTWKFETYSEFKEWVQGYVCVHCLVNFEELNGRQPKTLKDWLDMGCGCEIMIDDDRGLVDWEDEMKYTEAYLIERENYLENR